jgi:hypothetical protein
MYTSAKKIFGIFYQVIIFDIFFRQNDLKRLSAFCPNVIFGNIAVHRKKDNIIVK